MLSVAPEEMSDSQWNRHQRIIASFEAAWKLGERPKIGSYLPDNEPRRDALLLELVHAELEFRIKLGEPARVEHYLREYPSLRRSRETVLGLIQTECAIRRQTEPGLRLSRYRRRFPEFQVELRTPLAEASTLAANPAPKEHLSKVEPVAEGLLPRRLGKFLLREKLGVGSFGIVYRAWDTVLRREVAVKVPQPWISAAQPELRTFLREARNAIKLRHPNIVEILDAGPVEGHECVVRTFVEGMTLAELLSQSQLTPEETASLLSVVADAVDYAHGQQIVHRDLKPSNILIDREGKPYVMDFGLAKCDSGESTLSPAGMPGPKIGTPSYMAPEQVRGETALVDARSDVYSLGIVLYELLTGSVPFRGRGRMLEIQIQETLPTPPCLLNEEIPADLERICLKALAKESHKRYQSAREMADDLRNFLGRRPVGAEPVRVEAKPSGSWWKSKQRLATVSIASALVLVQMSTAALWLRAANHHARSSEGLDRAFRALIQLAEMREEGRSDPRSNISNRAWELIGGLEPMLEGDPALVEVAADTRLGLAGRASAEGSDALAGLAWESAIHACKNSLHHQPGRPSRLEDLAGALVKLAEIRRRAGDPMQAWSLFDDSTHLRTEALSLLEGRTGGSPDANARLLLIEARLRLAEGRRLMGESVEIDEVESSASELFLGHRPKTSEFQLRLARLILDIARWQLADGKPRQAEELVTMGYGLYRDSGPESMSGLDLARCSLMLARANRDLDREADATTWSLDAVRRFESLVRLDSGRPEDRRGLGEALLESARLLDRPNSQASAIDRYRQALRVRLDLVSDYPGAHATLAELGEVRAALAQAFESQGRKSASVANHALATWDQLKVLALAPHDQSYRSQLGDYASGLARSLWADRTMPTP